MSARAETDRRLRATLAVALATMAAGLGGCAGGGISRPDTLMPAAYEVGGKSDPSLSPATLDTWWRLYDDPQLTALIEEALENSPDARTGLQRIAESRASRSQTLAAYLPQGDLSGQAEDQHTTESFGGLGVTTGLSTGGTGTTGTTGTGGATGTTGSSGAYLTPAGDLQTYAAAFNVSYEVDLFGRRRAAKRAADADLWAQRFDYEATRSMLATSVANDLFQARGDAIQLAEARETLRIAQQLANSADVSAAHGLTSTSDAARLESDAATDAAEVARLEAVGRAARRTLLDLVGRGTASVDSLKVDPVAVAPPVPPPPPPASCWRAVPTCARRRRGCSPPRGTLALDKLALFPDFSLAPGLELAKTTGAYDSFSTVWTLGATRHCADPGPSAAAGHRARSEGAGRGGGGRLREGGAGRLSRRRERAEHAGRGPPPGRKPAGGGGPGALRLQRQAARL